MPASCPANSADLPVDRLFARTKGTMTMPCPMCSVHEDSWVMTTHSALSSAMQGGLAWTWGEGHHWPRDQQQAKLFPVTISSCIAWRCPPGQLHGPRDQQQSKLFPVIISSCIAWRCPQVSCMDHVTTDNHQSKLFPVLISSCIAWRCPPGQLHAPPPEKFYYCIIMLFMHLFIYQSGYITASLIYQWLIM